MSQKKYLVETIYQRLNNVKDELEKAQEELEQIRKMPEDNQVIISIINDIINNQPSNLAKNIKRSEFKQDLKSLGLYEIDKYI